MALNSIDLELLYGRYIAITLAITSAAYFNIGNFLYAVRQDFFIIKKNEVGSNVRSVHLSVYMYFLSTFLTQQWNWQLFQFYFLSFNKLYFNSIPTYFRCSFVSILFSTSFLPFLCLHQQVLVWALDAPSAAFLFIVSMSLLKSV